MPTSILFWDYWKVGIVSDGIGSVIRIMIRQQKGVDPSNLDSNKGLVDNEYNLYKPLADAMKELNINAYRLADWFDQQSTNNK